MRWVRRIVSELIVLPILRIGYKLEVRGKEHLDGEPQPYLIIGNHNMHMDAWMLFRALPNKLRYRMAIAAAASDIFGSRFRGLAASFLGNAFPFSTNGSGVRDSLEHISKLLEQGESVLIFPEGRLTVLGPMQAFGKGTSWVAVNSGVAVLPMRIDVVRPGFREGRWLPHPRANVRINIGKPISFEKGTSYAEATAALEHAVRTA
jgi:1-acyl-sn-glycerol-3-phosphate acyltransferase